MSKKLLNVTGIQNELSGASLFFQRPKPPETNPTPQPTGKTIGYTQPLPQEREVDSNPPVSEADADRSTDGRTGAPTHAPKKRKIERHTFDVYEDQVIALQRLQLNAALSGRRKPKMGDMVRKGIDMFLTVEAKRHRKRS
jgi:hypothetical protein